MSEIEDTSGLAVRVVIRPSTRKGVLSIRAEAAHQSDGRLVSVEVLVKGEYPSAEATTLGGELFRLLVALSKEVEQPPPLLPAPLVGTKG
jgi:hypothetical protein